MKQFEVITPWIGTGAEENINRPKICDDYSIPKWSDVTGQQNPHPTTPNGYTILAECADVVFTQIEGDSTYHILWSADV